MARDTGAARATTTPLTAALTGAIPARSTLLLDTSTLAAYLGTEPTSPLAREILDELVASGRNRAVVCAVTLTELLVRPIRAGVAAVEQAVVDLATTFPNLELVPVDLAVARTAAVLRVRYGMRTPDALIAAAGVDRSAGIGVSDDAGWPDVVADGDRRMRVVTLRSLLPADGR